MSKANLNSGSECNERETTTATVGTRYREEHEVPAVVGEFEHKGVPNDKTTTWVRRYSPTENKYPYIKVAYNLSCMGNEGTWDISRTIETRQKVDGYSIQPKAGSGVISDLLQRRTIMCGLESLDRAIGLVTEMLEAESKREGLPSDLDKSVKQEYRKLEKGRF